MELVLSLDIELTVFFYPTPQTDFKRRLWLMCPIRALLRMQPLHDDNTYNIVETIVFLHTES